ncbi:MAG: hypothetical protein DSM107014_16060 [Gomphosphaeria aponina SAG 52.96 = DSM 107014]|uniref:Uncharacterized protein n=1 Tax=Gomphosphaeria aponina SAG 52.96 = DSM 107014 TaxID=1521640 RepID=A0A941GT78_9CHRO|nr:hypothetical protein [Gomphosphaeria aponina SAG 52.96 = DSM 107014]
MYITTRGMILRNATAAIFNGSITLGILLIAPLGLAAVITNTLLVTGSTFLVCSGADLVVSWLIQPVKYKGSFFRKSSQGEIESIPYKDIERQE